MTNQLHEAKNVGDHAATKNPWRHHALVATLSAAVRPGRTQALQDMGQRMTFPKFARLEADFRKELTDAFSTITTDSEMSNRKMKRIFRVFYTQAFQLGQSSLKGGMSNRLPTLTQEDRRWIETFLRKEFDLWKKFIIDVKTKKGKMDYDQRKEMYVQTLRSMYQGSRAIGMPPMTLFYWDTTPAEHCPHCLYLKSKSPFTKDNLPTVPAGGDTQCKSNCRCHLRTAQASIPEYLRVKRKSPTRQELLRGMRALTK